MSSLLFALALVMVGWMSALSDICSFCHQRLLATGRALSTRVSRGLQALLAPAMLENALQGSNSQHLATVDQGPIDVFKRALGCVLWEYKQKLEAWLRYYRSFNIPQTMYPFISKKEE